MGGWIGCCLPSSTVFIRGPLLTGREKARDGAGVCPSDAHSNVILTAPTEKLQGREKRKVPAAFGPPAWPVLDKALVPRGKGARPSTPVR